MARFLFRAQDRNMTNGDYAFFTFWPARKPLTDYPWDWYNTLLGGGIDMEKRKKAFGAVKQVLYLLHTFMNQFCRIVA